MAINAKPDILRLSLTLVLAALWSVSRCQTVTARFVNEPLSNVLKEAERQTCMSFIYNVDVVDGRKRITADFRHTPIKEVLESVLDRNVGFVIQKKLVVLYRKKDTRKGTPPQQRPPDIVRGHITDTTGEPVAGASVVCRESGKATISDGEGRFALGIPHDCTLDVSFIGYTKASVSTGQQRYLSVVLHEDQHELGEVVVIGYGSATRKDIIGAVEQIKSDRLEGRPDGAASSALQGQTPSLIVQKRSFDPNEVTNNINIRGISTTNSNAPLLVVDGIVYPDNSLDKLNINDIDNISILKDAGAAAIYGSRSANGVLLVTTKKGRRSEHTAVRLSTSVGMQVPLLLYRPVAGYRNAELRNLSFTNTGLPEEFTSAQISDLYKYRAEERWFLRQIFHTALQQNHNLSVTGGTRRTSYMVSMGYYNQRSNYVGNHDYGTGRLNLRSNLSTQTGILKIQALLAYSRTTSTSTTGTGLERDASRVPPYYYYKMKDNGRYLLNDVLTEFNPLGSLEAGGENQDSENDFTASGIAELNIARGLKLKAVVGADINGRHTYMRQKTVAYYTSSYQQEPARYDRETHKAADTDYDSYFVNTQLLADYNVRFGRHNVSALLGFTNESASSRSNAMTVVYANADLGTTGGDDAYVKLGDATRLSPEDLTTTNICSFLGRVGYNYAERYYGEFAFRHDGSSKFAQGRRWGFFPSFSLGWRISEERFMSAYKRRVGNLKLRGSYGILGNQTIGAYDRFTTYRLYNYSYSFNNKPVTGAGISLGSESLRWERVHTFDAGLEADFFRRRLSIVFDCFYKQTKDILMRPVTASTFGTEQSLQNSGEMSNRGWELTVKLDTRTGKALHTVSANIGDTYNRLEKFPEDEQISRLEELWVLRRTGVPLSSYYGYRTAGFFRDEADIRRSALPIGARVEPGDLKFVDRNGDNIIDSSDRFVLGNAFPRYNFGFSYSLKWKGIDFNFFVNGVGKRDMMVRGELVEPFHGNFSYVIYDHQLDFWTSSNTHARYPRLTAPGSSSATNNYRLGSDIYIFNAAYARLKDLTVGYTLPRNFTSRFGVSRLRLYISGQNLLTLSHNPFIDPESTEFDSRMSYSEANTGCNYPTLRYWGFGLDVEF